jgi:hypothetical protein
VSIVEILEPDWEEVESARWKYENDMELDDREIWILSQMK